MIVWGGRHGGANCLSDGAAYDPSTDSWRTLAPAPIDARTNAIAVWTGTELFIWGGNAGIDTMLYNGASGNVFALDTATGDWRSLPWLFGYGRDQEAAWDGSQLHVLMVDDESPVAVQRLALGDDQWTSSLPGSMSGSNFDADAVVWTGEGFAVVSSSSSGRIYDTLTERWAPITRAGSSVRLPAVWTEFGVVFSDRLYDIDLREWVDLGPPPRPFRESATAVWTGEEYLVSGGDACGPGALCVALVDPESGVAWRP